MSDKLVIALYNNQLITVGEYQAEVHKEIFCPFCNPSLRVTHNIQGFFRAWPNMGGHNCGRGQVIYFDADWKGREFTEIIRDEEQNLQIIIDIDSLVKDNLYMKGKNNSLLEKNPDIKKEYAKYKERQNVFRDVIKSVLQMKRLLEKNDYSQLQKIKFKYKTGYNQYQSINDIVIPSYRLSEKHIKKSLFIIFAVDTVYCKNNTVYFNGVSYESVNLTAILAVTESSSAYKAFEGNNVIAYGYITYKKESEKYFLNLNHDYQILKLNKDKSDMYFEDKTGSSYDHRKYKKTEEIKEDSSNILSKQNDAEIKYSRVEEENSSFRNRTEESEIKKEAINEIVKNQGQSLCKSLDRVPRGNEQYNKELIQNKLIVKNNSDDKVESGKRKGKPKFFNFLDTIFRKK